ncbi:IDEAL domain-containing protein [Virgibacillus ainsalahensis]
MKVSLKLRNSCHIKADSMHIQVMLGDSDITAIINGLNFSFTPMIANEIKINQKSKQIENRDALFAFQKKKDIISMTMTELITVPGFLPQLYNLIEPYYNIEANVEYPDEKTEMIVEELQQKNIKRLIDKALDEKDEEAFYFLMGYMKI